MLAECSSPHSNTSLQVLPISAQIMQTQGLTLAQRGLAVRFCVSVARQLRQAGCPTQHILVQAGPRGSARASWLELLYPFATQPELKQQYAEAPGRG